MNSDFDPVETRRDNIIIAARLCLDHDFSETSRAILKLEIAKFDLELQKQD